MQEKLITEVHEDFKSEVEEFDNKLDLKDIDESKIEDDENNNRSMNQYQSTKRNKSNAMLSQYKSFTIRKTAKNPIRGESEESLQLGQGWQK